jgi:hypothetical protein
VETACKKQKQCVWDAPQSTCISKELKQQIETPEKVFACRAFGGASDLRAAGPAIGLTAARALVRGTEPGQAASSCPTHCGPRRFLQAAAFAKKYAARDASIFGSCPNAKVRERPGPSVEHGCSIGHCQQTYPRYTAWSYRCRATAGVFGLSAALLQPHCQIPSLLNQSVQYVHLSTPHGARPPPPGPLNSIFLILNARPSYRAPSPRIHVDLNARPTRRARLPQFMFILEDACPDTSPASAATCPAPNCAYDGSGCVTTRAASGALTGLPFPPAAVEAAKQCNAAKTRDACGAVGAGKPLGLNPEVLAAAAAGELPRAVLLARGEAAPAAARSSATAAAGAAVGAAVGVALLLTLL